MAFDEREYNRQYRQRNRVRLLEQQRARRARDRAQWLAFGRAYYQANRERIRAAQREHYQANRQERLEHNKTMAHGLPRIVRDWMYESQDRACAGCRTPRADVDLEVDHDHQCCPGTRSCGRCVRGLLCRSCNARDILATKVG